MDKESVLLQGFGGTSQRVVSQGYLSGATPALPDTLIITSRGAFLDTSSRGARLDDTARGGGRLG